MAVLGYGGLALLVPSYLGLGHLARGLGDIGDRGLAILIISAGTVGLLVAKDLFTRRGWWHEAQVFGFWLNLACAADALRLGKLQLAGLVVVITGAEWLAERLWQGAEKNAAKEDND